MIPPPHSEIDLSKILAKALVEEQLRLFVQPQISIRRGTVVGGEVLLRMPDFESNKYFFTEPASLFFYSNISIDQWIQTAVNQGLIHSLSEWLVKNVFKILQNRYQSGYRDVPLSVNMPPEIINNDFVELMQKCFTDYCNVSADKVAIEITEFPQAKNLKALNKTVQRLRSMGVKVILDDFGSGYATMNYLVELEVDAVKIDKTIVQKAPQSPSARAILRCLIDLATEINIQVICEGIETVEQFLLLQEMECDVIQGFLISEAVPFEQFWQNLEVGFQSPVPYWQMP